MDLLKAFDLSCKNVLFGVGGKVNSKDPNAVVELDIPVRPLLFPVPGNYGVTVHIDGSLLLNRTIYVKQAPSR